MRTSIDGTGVAIVTPFHNYGTVDFTSLEKIINHVIDGGVDFILALGTTSEAATLSSDEKTAVVNFVLEIVNKRIPVMVGCSTNSTHSAIDMIKSENFDGIEAILSVVPYYNKPNQKGLYNHFKMIASASPVPVILYNVPGRTCTNITTETALRLAKDFDNIAGIKEASGNMNQVMTILRDRPKDFKVFSGDDMLTFPLMTMGADGVISVAAMGYPKEFSEMVRLLKKKKYNKALEIHFSLMEFVEDIFADGNPGGIKAALSMMDLLKYNMRLPLVKVNKALQINIQNFINNYRSPLDH
jgi:4-hydroxy-tetrahydrodipicolinate synthase